MFFISSSLSLIILLIQNFKLSYLLLFISVGRSNSMSTQGFCLRYFERKLILIFLLLSRILFFIIKKNFKNRWIYYNPRKLDWCYIINHYGKDPLFVRFWSTCRTPSLNLWHWPIHETGHLENSWDLLKLHIQLFCFIFFERFLFDSKENWKITNIFQIMIQLV